MEGFSVDDFISTLPDIILHRFLARLSVKEVLRTSVLSKRWMDLWKEMPDLFLDMRPMDAPRRTLSSPYVALNDAKSITKVIKDHRGNLERCRIYHYSHQCIEGMVEAWIQSLIHEKHTKNLKLVNFIGGISSFSDIRFKLYMSPELLSHPSLESLYLVRYDLKTPDGFKNCWNLKKLKLIGIYAEIGVFNTILLSCTSLQVLVLNINCYNGSGDVPLKIENRNLKFLSLTCYSIDGVEVASPNLDILTIGTLSCEIDKFVISNPKLHFNRNYWATGKLFSHTSCNLSCANQEEKSIGHEFMMSESAETMRRFASMSVSIDLNSSKEVDMLREILLAWPVEMAELEIVFKNYNNGSKQEGESSSGRRQKKFWEETKPFPYANFHAYTVWLFEFSGSEEEFVFASRFITQGTVVRIMMIKPSSDSHTNRLEIEQTVANLKTLPKGHKDLKILMV